LEDAKALRPILYFEKITEVTHLFLRAWWLMLWRQY
jgi:hypothetical protein